MVTHFGYPVFEVLQWVSVPGTGTAHHLLTETECKVGIKSTETKDPVSGGISVLLIFHLAGETNLNSPT